MSAKQALHKIEDVAEDVGEKIRGFASRGAKFMRQKTAGIASAVKRLWH